jgi:hypothetical protein
VTGYQGMDPLPQDGYYIVRNSHAHAWTEVWFEGRGWVRVDPTAAVAPERVAASRPLRPQPGAVAAALEAVSPALLARLRATWERTNNRWNQWVLNYSRNDQFDLLQRLGFRTPDWVDLAYVLLALLTASGVAGAAWALWDRRRRDPWQRQARRIAKTLARLGIPAHAHETPRTLAERVRAALGARGEALATALGALELLRYGRQGLSRPSRDWWRGFARAAASASR